MEYVDMLKEELDAAQVALAVVTQRLRDVDSALQQQGIDGVGSRGQRVPNRLLAAERALRRDEDLLRRRIRKLHADLRVEETRLENARLAARANEITAWGRRSTAA